MRPRIAQAFEGALGFVVPIPGYGFLLSLSLLLAVLWTYRALKRFGIEDESRRLSLLLGVMIGMYFGAKSLYLLQYHHQVGACLRQPLVCVRDGYSLYGGLVGIVTVVWCYSRHWGLNPLAPLDAMTAPMALGLALTRVGCFLAGCNFGRPTDLPWSVRFPSGSPAWFKQISEGALPSNALLSLSVHPTQLYESIVGIALCLGAIALSPKLAGRGQLFFAMVGAYALFRAVEEKVRADAGGVTFGPFTFAQVVSIVLLLTATLGFLRAAPRCANSRDAVHF